MPEVDFGRVERRFVAGRTTVKLTREGQDYLRSRDMFDASDPADTILVYLSKLPGKKAKVWRLKQVLSEAGHKASSSLTHDAVKLLERGGLVEVK